MNFAFVEESLLFDIYLALYLARNHKTHLNSLQTVKHLPKWQERFTCHTIMKFNRYWGYRPCHRKKALKLSLIFAGSKATCSLFEVKYETLMLI